MPGHVFLVRGDIRRLACDAWLMPCGATGRPRDIWLLPGQAPRWPRLPPEWRAGRQRVLPLEDWPDDCPRPWLVNADGDPDVPVAWYVEGVRQFLEQARRWLGADRPHWFERARPLLALPLLGTGQGGGRQRAGEMVAAFLPLLREATHTANLDVVLVTHNGPAFAAAQAARQQQEGDPWPDLDEDQRVAARELARQAARGELALFLGAGASASAGLPLWGPLLDRLARLARFDDAESEALRRLNPLDQAGLIEKRLGGPEGLQEALRRLFTWGYYGLPHALLAALPVREVVTTNYDQLFEQARTALGCPPSVLPYDLRPESDGWVLKMHGCVSHPEDIVLTRTDVIGYGKQHAALAGIVQALLITRHMLFVGFSLNDDTFHRIADAVRRVVRPPGRDADEAKPFGTAVVLRREPLIEELWGHDLEWVGMNGRAANRDEAAAARRLEIFLDYLLAQVRDEAHLLDPRYPAVLTAADRALRDSLLEFLERLPAAARDAPAWPQVERLLRTLGYRPPLREA